MKRIFLVGILTLSLTLGGCGNLPSLTSATAAATVSVSAEQAKLQKVLDTWPIDKGILEEGVVGLTAAGQPAAAAIVTAGIAKGDQVVADAHAVLNTATVTVAALQTISDQFTDLVATLKSAAAPAISVEPTVPTVPTPG